jgi:hypothetical protein
MKMLADIDPKFKEMASSPEGMTSVFKLDTPINQTDYDRLVNSFGRLDVV